MNFLFPQDVVAGGCHTPVLDSDLLKHFTFQAEESGDYELVDYYYKERVDQQDHISELWYNYGGFKCGQE